MLDQLETHVSETSLANNLIPQNTLNNVDRLYQTVHLPALYLGAAQDILSEAYLEKLFQQLRQGEASCCVCLQSGDRLYDTTTSAVAIERGNTDGHYIISGAIQNAYYAQITTHFIIPARLEVTESVESEEGETVEHKVMKLVMCIVPKGGNTKISASGSTFDVYFDKVPITASESFLCAPGEAVPQQIMSRISAIALKAAVVLGRLHGLTNHMEKQMPKELSESDKNAFICASALTYALQSALYLNASIQEAKEEGLARAAALYVFTSSVLRQIEKLFAQSSSAPWASRRVFDMVQHTKQFFQADESVATTRHLLACLTTEDRANVLNSTSTLDLMQQRTLKKFGISKPIRYLRDAVEKRKAKSPTSARPALLKAIDERLAEFESEYDKITSFLEKFIGKSGSLIANQQYQSLSIFAEVHAELFVRFCTLSRAFSALERDDGQSTAMLVNTFCALSTANTQQIFDYICPKDGEASQAMLDAHLDSKISSDIFVRL